MQRAEATTSYQSATSSEPSSKRRRVDFASASSTPTPQTRATNLARPASNSSQIPSPIPLNAVEGDETEWVLTLKLSQAEKGYADTNGYHLEDSDDSEEDIWKSQSSGRQTYGSFKKIGKTATMPVATNQNDDLSSASDSDDSALNDSLLDHDNRGDSSPFRHAQSNGRPTQAPKRFFTQINSDTPIASRPSPHERNPKRQKQSKKPRVTI
jgi:hypothetical protein